MSQFETGNVLDRIEMSPNLRGSLQRAMTYAYEQSHRQVTLEHLLLALVDDREAAVILESSSVDVPALRTDVSDYLGRLDDRTVDGQRRQPELGGDVQHIIQSAGAAAQKSQRRAVSSALVLAAVVGDGRSPSAQILRSHGLTFENAISALKQANAAKSANPGQQPASGSGIAPGPAQSAPSQPAAPDIARPAPAPATLATGPTLAAKPPPPGSGSAARLQNMQAAHEIIAGARERIAAARGVIASRSVEPLASTPSEPLPEGVPQYVDQAPVPELATAPSRVAPSAETGQKHSSPQPSKQAQPVTEPVVAPAAKAEVAPRPGRTNASSQAARVESPTSSRLTDVGTAISAAPEMVPNAHGNSEGAVATTAPAEPQNTSSASQTQPTTPRLAPPPKLAPPPAFEPAARPGPVVPPAPQVSRPRPDMPPGGAPAPEPPRQTRPASPPAQPSVTPPPPAPAMHPAGPPLAVGQPSTLPAGPQTPPMPGPLPGRSRRPEDSPPRQQPPNYGQQPGQRPAGPAGGISGMPEYAPVPQAAPPPAFSPPGVRPPGQQPPDVSPIDPEQLVEDVPTWMRVGVPTTIEIRAPRARLEAWSGGNPDPRARDEQIITKAMVMRLKAPEGGFTVEVASPETQWSEGYMGPLSDDVVSWRWIVTPVEYGRLPLQLTVSTRVVGRDGLAAARVLPEQLVTVRVAPNYGRIASRLAIGLALALSGLIIGYFADGLFSMGSSILAQQ